MDRGILFITRHFPPPYRGGTYIYYFNLYRNLDISEKIIILAPAKSQANILDSGIPHKVIRLNFLEELPDTKLKKFKNFFFLIAEILSLRKKYHITQIHLGQFYPDGLLGIIFLKLFSIPYLVFIHGEDVSQFLCHYRGIRYLLAKAILKYAYLVITNSKYSLEMAKKIWVQLNAKAHILSPAVDKKHFSFQPDKVKALKKRLKIDKQKVILSVARLVPQKGHAKVIKALLKLLPHYHNFIYLIAGEGEERKNLEKLIRRLNLEDHVLLIGHIDYNDLPALYATAHIFILANYDDQKSGLTEGYGMVVKEAMAMGLPVIGGNFGGVREIICHGKDGILIDTRDVKKIEESLLLLLKDDNLRNSLGENAKRKVTFQADWKELADEFAKIILKDSVDIKEE